MQLRLKIVAVLLALAAVAVGLLLAADASQTFNPALSIGLANPNTSANSNVGVSVSLPSGDLAIANWGLLLPLGWQISSGSQVPYGDTVAQGTIFADIDCTGTVDQMPFTLTNQPGDSTLVAVWTGQVNSWWSLTLSVDGNASQGYDMSLSLTDFTQNHNICTPETVSLNVLGMSSPSNAAVIANPSSAGTDTFTGAYLSFGAIYSVDVPAAVCVGSSCPTATPTPVPTPTPSPTPTPTPSITPTPASCNVDSDGDGVPDCTDNCPNWPNPAQNLPPWPVASNDPDCDGFSTAAEAAIGTSPLIQCAAGAWPPDFNNDQRVNLLDMITMKPAFGTVAPGPPYNPRFDLNMDGRINLTDVIVLKNFFGQTCGLPDSDADGIADGSDNCPNWFNPAQSLPPWPVPTGDPDCDGFSTSVETFIGTDPLRHCGTNAWPPDFNNSGTVDLSDVLAMRPHFNSTSPSAAYSQRFDLNADNTIGLTDVLKLKPFFVRSCS